MKLFKKKESEKDRITIEAEIQALDLLQRVNESLGEIKDALHEISHAISDKQERRPKTRQRPKKTDRTK